MGKTTRTLLAAALLLGVGVPSAVAADPAWAVPGGVGGCRPQSEGS
ncbi:hypothetical protein [Streptomyces sp. NPDC126503]